MEETSCDAGYLIDCCHERAFICLRRFVKAADFSHELERRSSNLFGRDWRIEIEESSYIPTHLTSRYQSPRDCERRPTASSHRSQGASGLSLTALVLFAEERRHLHL